MTKKEFIEMINSDDYTKQENLYRIIRKKGTNFVGDEYDNLEICLKPINGYEMSKSAYIETRDFNEFKIQVENLLAKWFIEIGEEFSKRWKNGKL